MANLTEYDLSGIRGSDLVGTSQTINTMSGGLLGISMLLAICVVVFSILALFGDMKAALYGSSFTGLILGLVFMGMGILSPAIFFLFVILVIVIVILITR